jgi:hypothetical protein
MIMKSKSRTLAASTNTRRGLVGLAVVVSWMSAQPLVSRADDVAAAAAATSTGAGDPQVASAPPVVGGAGAAAARASIQVLGEGDQTLYVVDHGGTWSMHADNLRADLIFQLWRTVGGPRAASRNVLDHAFTMSLHRVAPERIVERILEGFNYTLHYTPAGKLDAVHVLSAQASRMYKTPRLVEGRSRWSEAEMALLAPVTGAVEEEDGQPPSTLPPVGEPAAE